MQRGGQVRSRCCVRTVDEERRCGLIAVWPWLLNGFVSAGFLVGSESRTRLLCVRVWAGGGVRTKQLLSYNITHQSESQQMCLKEISTLLTILVWSLFFFSCGHNHDNNSNNHGPNYQLFTVVSSVIQNLSLPGLKGKQFVVNFWRKSNINPQHIW